MLKITFFLEKKQKVLFKKQLEIFQKCWRWEICWGKAYQMIVVYKLEYDAKNRGRSVLLHKLEYDAK